MVTAAGKRLHDLFTYHESSSSSLSSSIASSIEMDLPPRSFQSFIRTYAPPPQLDPSRALPPVPCPPRRSSSVYSIHDAKNTNLVSPARDKLPSTEFFLQPTTFSHSQPNLQEHTQGSETPFYLEAKTYSPGILRHYQSPTPPSSSPSLSLTHESDQFILPQNLYTSADSSAGGSITQTAAKLRQATSWCEFNDTGENHLQTSYLQNHHMYPLDDLAQSPTHDAVFFSTDDAPTSPLLPPESAISIDRSPRKRVISQEKGLISMGMDSHTLQEEVDHRSWRHLLSPKPQLRPSPRPRDYTREERRIEEASTLLISSRTSVASTNTSEDSNYGSRIFAKDYHALLTDQYRSEHAAVESEEDVKAAMRMVPAPLFFQKTAAKHKRNISAKSQDSSKKSSTISISPKKAGIPGRLVSLIGHGHGSIGGSTDRSRSIGHAGYLSTEFESKSNQPKTSARLADLFMHSTIGPNVTQAARSPELKQSPTPYAPYRSSSMSATETERNQPAFQDIGQVPESSQKPGRIGIFKSRLSQSGASSKPEGNLPNSVGHFFNAALDKAKEGFSSLAPMHHAEQDVSSGWETARRITHGHGAGSEVKRTKSQKRRDALKKSIRIVGDVDPNALAVAERLGGVDLGRLRPPQ